MLLYGYNDHVFLLSHSVAGIKAIESAITVEQSTSVFTDVCFDKGFIRIGFMRTESTRPRSHRLLFVNRVYILSCEYARSIVQSHSIPCVVDVTLFLAPLSYTHEENCLDAARVQKISLIPDRLGVYIFMVARGCLTGLILDISHLDNRNKCP